MRRNQFGDVVSDQEFTKIFQLMRSPVKVARHFKIDPATVCRRRRTIEKKYGVSLETTADGRVGLKQPQVSEKVRARIEIKNGSAIIGSDCHYWPDIVSTAHRGLVHLTQKLKPIASILNGDVIDGSTISRWPKIGWEHRPSVKDELKVAQDRLEEVEKASLNSKCYWTFGNHDARFEMNIAKLVPEYEGVAGFSLKEHFPRWQPCMSVMVNDNVIIKHRYKGGIHATHNNAVNAGITIVTGHLHSLKVTPFSDYNGDRYGVDTGTLADPWGPQFESYMEDSPRNWRSGFAVLEFRNGVMMPPELCHVIEEDAIWFRGNRIEV